MAGISPYALVIGFMIAAPDVGTVTDPQDLAGFPNTEAFSPP